MKKFEYVSATYRFIPEAKHLNVFGSQGWELVAVTNFNGQLIYFWKRALPESNDKTETK